MILWSVIWHYASSFGIDQVVADSKETAAQRVIAKHGAKFGERAYLYVTSGDVTFEPAKNFKLNKQN